MRKLELTGRRYGKLLVESFSHIGENGSSYWNCNCDCGNKLIVIGKNLSNNNTSSCGCYHGRLKHGCSKHILYKRWDAMIQRCTNPNTVNYTDYGGRGIKVCKRWLDVRNFIEDMFPSWKEGLQLDRKDNDGNYELSNCQWSTPSKNQKNKRNSSTAQCDIDYVSFSKKDRKWVVYLRFDTIEEASKALSVLGKI